MLLNCGVGEDSWKSLDCKEIKPVHPKGNQYWIFIGRKDAEAETSILWPPYVKNWLIWKDPDAGKDWRREEKGMTEDEMIGWHHQLRHEFEQALGVGDGQGSLASCSLWGLKESVSDWTELKLEKDSVTTTGLTMDGVIGVMWTVSNNWEQISADNQQRSRNFRTIHAKHWFCQQSDGTWNVAPSQSLQTRPQPSQHLDFSTSWDLKQRSQLRAPGTSTQRSNLHLQHLLHCKQILYHCAPWKALQSG